MDYQQLLIRISSRIRNQLVCPFGWTKSQIQRRRPTSEKTDYPIDFVVTWVDGNDPEWKKEKDKYVGEMTDEIENTPARYRDWGLLQYWFRAVERYAPWVRKVFLVTSGQKPDWINLNYEKLVFVTHEEFIPEQYLPTFNSRTIEMNLWRMNDLSEHFVYFNDDFFLNRPVEPEDFYENGLPRLCAVALPFYFHSPTPWTAWRLALLNDIGLINDTFDIRQVMRKYPEKFFSYVYGRKIKYNRRVLDDAYITGMYYSHAPYIYLKSVFADIWKTYPEIMDVSCRDRFRNHQQVTVLLPILWMIFQGKFIPVDAGYLGPMLDLNHQTIGRIEELLSSEERAVCLNDGQNADEEDEETRRMIYDELHRVMRAKFPDRSKYEL